MAVRKKEEVDALLEQHRPGFFEGIWLALKITGRFLISLGPQNWSLQRIAQAQLDVNEGPRDTNERTEGTLLK